MQKTFKIEIDPKIMQIKGFDENCLWVMCKIVDIMKTYRKNSFKRVTIAKYTGWGLKKVDIVLAKLDEIKILEKNHTTRACGGKGANSYRILTGFISWVEKENQIGSEFITSTEESEDHFEEENTSEMSIGENHSSDKIEELSVPKSPIAMSENDPSYKRILIPNSLNTSSTSTPLPPDSILESIQSNPLYGIWSEKIISQIGESEFKYQIQMAIGTYQQSGKVTNSFQFLKNYMTNEIPKILEIQKGTKKLDYYKAKDLAPAQTTYSQPNTQTQNTNLTPGDKLTLETEYQLYDQTVFAKYTGILMAEEKLDLNQIKAFFDSLQDRYEDWKWRLVSYEKINKEYQKYKISNEISGLGNFNNDGDIELRDSDYARAGKTYQDMLDHKASLEQRNYSVTLREIDFHWKKDWIRGLEQPTIVEKVEEVITAVQTDLSVAEKLKAVRQSLRSKGLIARSAEQIKSDRAEKPSQSLDLSSMETTQGINSLIQNIPFAQITN